MKIGKPCLKVDSRQRGGGITKDFICYLYAPDSEINLTDKMYTKGSAFDRGNSSEIVIKKDGIIFGPYLSLCEGIYKLCIDIGGKPENLACKITADKGTEELQTLQLEQGKNNIELVLLEDKKDIEFVIENNGADISVNKIFFVG